MKTKKEFPTLAVMGAYTGFVLGRGPRDGFGGIHEVMDHLYPGIMTIGVAAMSKNAAAAIASQIPSVKDVPGNPADFEAFAAKALEMLGPTLALDGPLAISDTEIKQAFDDFGEPTP